MANGLICVDLTSDSYNTLSAVYTPHFHEQCSHNTMIHDVTKIVINTQFLISAYITEKNRTLTIVMSDTSNYSIFSLDDSDLPKLYKILDDISM